MSNSASAIKAAEAALDKGDYSLCIKIIDPLLLSYSATTEIGAQLRLLKVFISISLYKLEHNRHDDFSWLLF